MNFKKTILISSLAFLSFSAYSQEFKGLTEGKDYLKAQATENIIDTKTNKPILVEFFWYGCGHCFAMKPLSSKLFDKYKSTVIGVKQPAGFDGWVTGTKIFYTLQNMNLLDSMHDKVFDEIHIKKKNILKKDDERDSFLKSNSVDVAKFNSFYNSFGMTAQLNKAKKITESLKVESTPAYVIYSGGYTYQVSPSLTGSYDNTIKVLDTILEAKVSKK